MKTTNVNINASNATFAKTSITPYCCGGSRCDLHLPADAGVHCAERAFVSEVA